MTKKRTKKEIDKILNKIPLKIPVYYKLGNPDDPQNCTNERALFYIEDDKYMVDLLLSKKTFQTTKEEYDQALYNYRKLMRLLLKINDEGAEYSLNNGKFKIK